MTAVTPQSKTPLWKRKDTIGISAVGLSIWQLTWFPDFALGYIPFVMVVYSLIGLYFVVFTLLLQRCDAAKRRQPAPKHLAALIGLLSIVPFYGLVLWLQYLITTLPPQQTLPYIGVALFLLGAERLWSAVDEDFGWSSRAMPVQIQAATRSPSP